MEDVTDDSEEEIVDFENMDAATRRKLVRRLRETPVRRMKTDSPYDPGSEMDVAWRAAVEKIKSKSAEENAVRAALAPAVDSLLAQASLYSLEISEAQAVSLLKGSCLRINDKIYRVKSNGELLTRQPKGEKEKVDNLWRYLRVNHNIDTLQIRHDPFGVYSKKLSQRD